MGKKNQHNRQTKHKQTPNLNRKQAELNAQIELLLRLTTQPPNQNVSKELEAVREIDAILQKIKKFEKRVDDEYAVENDKRCNAATIDRFTTWLLENGATFKGTSISEFPGYDLGLKAEIDIPEASLIIGIPRKLMFTIDAVKNSTPIGVLGTDAILENMPNVALSIFLLLEKFAENSFWKPYIDILPVSYTTVLYFSVDELEKLTGSPTLKTALNQIKNIARQYAYFYKLINAAKDSACEILRKRFTYREYCWAVSTIMTRQNSIPSQDNKSQVNALIPLWDMCNHTNGNISTDYNPDLDRCECLAVRKFTAGEQLFIFYGPRTNADLFVHNGFVYEENQHDYYPLNLGVSQSDVLREKRLRLLSRLNIDNAIFRLRKDSPPIDGQLLAFLRIFNMNEDQLDHWLQSEKSDDLEYSDCALDTLLEKKTWNFLQTRMKLLLAAYKTSLKQDEEFLQSSPTQHESLAVRMLASEKRILGCVLEYAEQYIKQ